MSVKWNRIIVREGFEETVMRHLQRKGYASKRTEKDMHCWCDTADLPAIQLVPGVLWVEKPRAAKAAGKVKDWSER